MNSPENMYLSRRHLAKPAEKKRKKKKKTLFQGHKISHGSEPGKLGWILGTSPCTNFQLKKYANSTDISKNKKTRQTHFIFR